MKSEIISIQTAKDFLKKHGHDQEYCEVTGGTDIDREYLGTHYDLIIAARALRLEYSIKEGLKIIYTPDWDNDNEYKYIVWCDMRGSGSGFAGTAYDFWRTNTHVGSRLCFPTEEIALYFVETFTKEHKTVMFEPKGGPVRGTAKLEDETMVPMGEYKRLNAELNLLRNKNAELENKLAKKKQKA